jgi:hypothetical protein
MYDDQAEGEGEMNPIDKIVTAAGCAAKRRCSRETIEAKLPRAAFARPAESRRQGRASD